MVFFRELVIHINFEVLTETCWSVRVPVDVLFWYFIILVCVLIVSCRYRVETGAVEKPLVILWVYRVTVLYSVVIALTLPASTCSSISLAIALTSVTSVVPARLLLGGLTESCRVVMEDLLGEGQTEGVVVRGAGGVLQVQVLLRDRLQGLGQPEGEVVVLSMEDPGSLLLHSVVEQKTRGP